MDMFKLFEILIYRYVYICILNVSICYLGIYIRIVFDCNRKF